MNSTLKLVLVAAAPWVIVAASPLVAHAAPPVQACSMLTTSEIRAAVGFAVDDGKGPDAQNCQWSEAGAGGRGRGLLLQVLVKMGSKTPADRFNEFKASGTTTTGMTQTPASGIGDDAVYQIIGGRSTMLGVRKGDFVFRIRVYGFTAEQAKDAEKALALDILAKR